MKTCLIVTDFSRASDHAIRYVLALFQQISSPCRILLLNTYLVPPAEPHKLIKINDEMKEKSLQGLNAELQLAQSLAVNPDFQFETLPYMGSLKNVISHIIQDKAVDLVIMGVEKSDPRDDVSHLCQKLSCPLLIVPLAAQAT